MDRLEGRDQPADRSGGSLPQEEQKHPEEWERDLNPDRMAGQNIGTPPTDRRTAYDVKEVHRSLSGMPDDTLKQIPILDPGTRLQQGATYLDLERREEGEFTAMGDREVSGEERIVPKEDVPYEIWNRLRQVDDPERL